MVDVVLPVDRVAPLGHRLAAQQWRQVAAVPWRVGGHRDAGQRQHGRVDVLERDHLADDACRTRDAGTTHQERRTQRRIEHVRHRRAVDAADDPGAVALGVQAVVPDVVAVVAREDDDGASGRDRSASTCRAAGRRCDRPSGCSRSTRVSIAAPVPDRDQGTPGWRQQRRGTARCPARARVRTACAARDSGATTRTAGRARARGSAARRP